MTLFKAKYSYLSTKNCTIKEVVQIAADGSDYERGQLETLQCGLQGLAAVVGQLAALLPEDKQVELANTLGWEEIE